MSDLSEDDTSDDSSKGFLVDPRKITAESSFFKSARKDESTRKSDSTDEDDTDNDESRDATQTTNFELFSQVLQNLENASASTVNESSASTLTDSRGERSVTTSNEIEELLLKGETGKSLIKRDTEDESSEREEAEAPVAEYSIPKEGVKITLPGTSLLLPRKRRGNAPDPLAVLRKHFREIQLLVVKVSLLCWLAHGFYLNRLINDPEIMAVSLSLLASCNYPKARVDVPYLEKFTKWFSNLFSLEGNPEFTCTNKEMLMNCARDKKFAHYSELVLLYVALMRGMGLNCRLIVSLCPPCRKLPETLMSEAQMKGKKGMEKKSVKKEGVKGSKGKTEDQEGSGSPKKETVVQNSLEAKRLANLEAKKRAAEVLKGKSREKGKPKKVVKVDKEEVDEKSMKKESPDKEVNATVSGLRRLRSTRAGNATVNNLKETKDSTDSSKSNIKMKEDEEDSGVESMQQAAKYRTRGSKRAATSKKIDDTTSKYYKKGDTEQDSTDVTDKKTTKRKNVRGGKAAVQEDDTVSKYYKKEDPVSNAEDVQEKKKRVTRKGTRGKAVEQSASTKSRFFKESNSDSEEESLSKTKTTKTRNNAKASTSKDADEEYIDEDDTNSDEDFKPSPPKKPARRKVNSENPQRSTKSKAIDRRILSSESDDGNGDPIKKEILWAEVYLESEESWISVCVPDAKVHCISELYRRAKKPVLYVIAWNSEGRIKDVTRRYCPKWLTVTRKKRIEEKWWTETLSHWKEKNTAISRAEDEMLLQKELAQPLPQTVGECKGHPLYVLARHLLKYEALYPPDCVPLGRTKTGEAIYSRHCVHTLRSRETWIKHARVVKPNQEPYKIVKALPKYDKLSGAKIKDATLEIFGEWQTTEYIPPVAKDGIVPRNEYGNVDLFQQSMLPKGTVHINLPGLNRVARKLNIDCAPAVVGFNFGGMGAVPAFEGFIVCEEFEDTLREAWEAEQQEAKKRAKEKREKRIYGNWKRLIQGLFIRERLAAKYEFEEQSKTTTKRTKQSKADAKKSKT